MAKFIALAALTWWSLAVSAMADPVGSYNVVGKNSQDGSEYHGSVTVARTGETYKVIWNIAGTKFDGVGIGAAIRDGSYLAGASDQNHTSLLVGYTSGGDYGPAFYVKQDDGSWRGVWSHNGSGRVSTENWFPK